MRILSHAKQVIRKGSRYSSTEQYVVDKPKDIQVPKKGHFAVYVGDQDKERKRFLVPISYLKHPLFQELLAKAEEEFGCGHEVDRLTVPCSEYYFTNLISIVKNS